MTGWMYSWTLDGNSLCAGIAEGDGRWLSGCMDNDFNRSKVNSGEAGVTGGPTA